MKYTRQISFSLVVLFFLISLNLHAQHTFSIVAVDTVTHEVGAAGASCTCCGDLGLGLNRLIPGKGAMNLQSHVVAANLDYAESLMRNNITPQQIIASLYLHDKENKPWNKQQAIIGFYQSGLLKVAFTGDSCSDFAGQIIGKNYVIGGNILAGKNILDSMEKGFLQSSGSFSDKLMNALLLAKVPGADRRCSQYGISSLMAFIRVARPTNDSIYSLNLHFSFDNPTSEDPIDKLYDLYKKATSLSLQNFIKPKIVVANQQIIITSETPAIGNISFYSIDGKKIYDNPSANLGQLIIPVESLPRGVYILDFSGNHFKINI